VIRLKHNQQGLLILALIWLAGAVSDRIWLKIDNSVPAWDQADYLNGSLNYWQALQQIQWFSSEWWTDFWHLSSKIPPGIYTVAAIIQQIFGRGIEQATLIHLIFSAILLTSVYGLGVQLFSREIGLWAAALCQLFPSLYRYRLEFVLDYPLTAVVTLTFVCLTLWTRSAISTSRIKQWLWAAAFGISFGLAILVKQTALFFLFVPVLWVGIATFYQRQWQRLLQLSASLLLSVVIFYPWYRTNWLTVLTSGKRATIDSAIAEGDPPLNTLAAWTYYWEILPYQVSWLLLLVPIIGFLLDRKRKEKYYTSLAWLAVFWLGAYFLCSLNINKDERYVLPYLPVVALLLAYGLTSWRGRWGNRIRWGSVTLAVLLMLLNLFPLGRVAQSIALLSPRAEHYAYVGSRLPHAEVIEEIIQQVPYLRSTLGVLPSTPQINQHNFNYYGALRDFQVYGRQVGVRSQQVAQDARSLDWFLTKTGDQGSVPAAQAEMVQMIERSPDFKLHKSWALPDGSTLNLYRDRTPEIEVTSVQAPSANVTLAQVTVPQQIQPGISAPVTYQWIGSWDELQSGLLLLDWYQHTNSQFRWIHDHAVGMGNLHAVNTQTEHGTFQVTERLAMLPPANLPAGTYTLKATYLNRNTGKTYPIATSPVTVNIEPHAEAGAAPELDLLTQLRILAASLPQGPTALEWVFEEIARINQYDPTQDYLTQTQQTLTYRLQQKPQNLELAYTLALSRVLKQQVNEAITALERVTKLDAQNPYAYAYLAFVHLYNWHGAPAETALKNARLLNPNVPEIQALSSVAALLQGNLIDAWHYFTTWQQS
jgi:4-amino-4-deoxy-L-arabinose transferase-like glycosyltransferase